MHTCQHCSKKISAKDSISVDRLLCFCFLLHFISPSIFVPFSLSFLYPSVFIYYNHTHTISLPLSLSPSLHFLSFLSHTSQDWKKGKKYKGVIVLDCYYAAKNETKNQDSEFSVYAYPKNMTCRATNPAEMQEWIDILNLPGNED